MELTFSEDQEELRRVVRRFLTERSPMAEVRRLMETEAGYDAAVWAVMGQQLGLQGLGIPERWGGGGFGWMEQVVVFEEMGRALLCAPYFATAALAASAVLASGDESAMADLLPGIASGATIATLAVTEADGRPGLGSIATTAGRSGGGWVLRGEKCFVIDGHVADTILVAAVTGAGGGVSLFAVHGDADGLRRSPLRTMDATRKQARLELGSTPARLVGVEGGAGPVLSKALDLARVALAAEQVGGAARCLDMAVDYAKVRVQFGRPIGSFQAVKHRCAEMLVEVEQARSAACMAGCVAAAECAGPGPGAGGPGSGELAVAASLAKAYCSDAYFRAAESCIQVHGGIGFTWEHDAHLYFKRAKSSQLLLGDPTYHRERIAGHIGM